VHTFKMLNGASTLVRCWGPDLPGAEDAEHQ